MIAQFNDITKTPSAELSSGIEGGNHPRTSRARGLIIQDAARWKGPNKGRLAETLSTIPRPSYFYALFLHSELEPYVFLPLKGLWNLSATLAMTCINVV